MPSVLPARAEGSSPAPTQSIPICAAKTERFIAVADAKTHGLNHGPFPANLRAWLKVPKPALGPVVSQAAGLK